MSDNSNTTTAIYEAKFGIVNDEGFPVGAGIFLFTSRKEAEDFGKFAHECDNVAYLKVVGMEPMTCAQAMDKIGKILDGVDDETTEEKDLRKARPANTVAV
jgi:hypothetical protein